MTFAIAENAATDLRAGGTDLSERRRSGIARGLLQDLTSVTVVGIAPGINWASDGSAQIGALTTIAAMADDAALARHYPGLVATAAGLATPQIRHLATLGGNLAQHTRCAYYRNPSISCLKKGGTDCPARGGHHLAGVAFDTSACVAPHPSSMACALLAYDALIATNQRAALCIDDLLGDGRDGRSDHALQAGEIITSVALRVPMASERAVYRRAISRTHAEWPLVEVVARAVIADGRFTGLRLAAGGLAPRPIRLLLAEQTAIGQPANAATILGAASAAIDGARALPQTGYKLKLLSGLVQDLLEQVAK